MKEEENVYATTEGTEDTAESRNRVENTAEKTASAVPDKFKGVDALARAYTALQAEFTRRSQRLKELEKKLENSDAEGRLGAEKLRKNARVRKEDAKRFEKFLAETEGRNTDAESMADEPIQNQPSAEAKVGNDDTVYAMNTAPDTGKSVEISGENVSEASDGGVQEENDVANAAVQNAQTQGQLQTSVAGSERGTIDSDTLYKQVCRDENVRLKIIGEYLSSLGRSDAPLMRGGVGTLTTPPRKASSISEAGDMALLYFKKPVEK